MNQEQSSQRLDKWLWSARFFKSRAIATKLLSASRVRLSGKVVIKSNQLVKKNDVLTFPQGSFIRVVKVLFLAERRGPAAEARLLFEDLSPIEQQREAAKKLGEFSSVVSDRPRGGGRPTKDDRRAIDRLMRRD